MKPKKVHVKYKGQPVCKAAGEVKFARVRADVTCKNCLRATER